MSLFLRAFSGDGYRAQRQREVLTCSRCGRGIKETEKFRVEITPGRMLVICSDCEKKGS